MGAPQAELLLSAASRLACIYTPRVPNSLDFLGHVAAIGTSTLWAFTSVLFTEAGRRIGATRVNAFRLVVAFILHWATFMLLAGAAWPIMNGSQLAALALSGFIGFVICDQAMFTALVDIGPRRALLMMTTSPIFATVMAWVFLDESPGWIAAVGIGLTLVGVAWVTLERAHPDAKPHTKMRRGVLLALIASASQAVGFLLSKRGMGHGVADAIPLDPQSATLVRVFFGLLGVVPVYIWRLRSERAARRGEPVTDAPGGASPVRRGYALAAAGAVTGPFLCVWCSLIAINLAPLGVAQTLCGLSPILILPIGWLVWKERITWRAAIGALIAVGGSAVLLVT